MVSGFMMMANLHFAFKFAKQSFSDVYRQIEKNVFFFTDSLSEAAYIS